MQRRSFLKGALVTLAGAFALPGRLLSAVKEGVVIHVCNGKETFVIPVGKWGLTVKVISGGETGPVRMHFDEQPLTIRGNQEHQAGLYIHCKHPGGLSLIGNYQSCISSGAAVPLYGITAT